MNQTDDEYLDSLIGGSHRPTTRTEYDIAAMAAAAGAKLDAQAAGEPAPPRTRICTRCTSIADASRAAGQPEPPIRQPLRWVIEGRVYWGANCGPCDDVEFAIRWQKRFAEAGKKNNAAEQQRLNNAVRERQKRTGRTVPIRSFVAEAGMGDGAPA